MRFLFPEVPWLEGGFYRWAFHRRAGPIPVVASLMLFMAVLLAQIEPKIRLLAELWHGGLVLLGLWGGIAAAGSAVRSLRMLRRLGLWGWVRPRWWFELSSLACTFFAFGMLLLVLVTLLSKIAPLQGVGNVLWSVALRMIFLSFWIFFAAAVAGYTVSVLGGRRCRGAAFDCVHPLFLGLGGVVLATIAGLHWPPQRVWPQGVLVVACGLAGLTLIVLLPLSGFKVLEKYCNSTKNNNTVPD